MPVLPQELVRIQASCTEAYIMCVAMHTENTKRIMEDKSLAYTEEDFVKLIEEYDIGYNSIIMRIRNASY